MQLIKFFTNGRPQFVNSIFRAKFIVLLVLYVPATKTYKLKIKRPKQATKAYSGRGERLFTLV